MASESHGISSASKLYNEVLRSIDYTFNTAVGDLIDNSIEAGASRIFIECDINAMTVAIVDNGAGMREATHIEAMKVASKSRNYSGSDLGKFGSGLKFASLSQCRKLTVATRSQDTEVISSRVIDLDHIAQHDDLGKVVEKADVASLPLWAVRMIEEAPGTIVFWEAIDKVFLSEEEGIRSRQDVMRAHLAELEEYLSVTFSRFIKGEVPERASLELYLNGNLVEAWDPFLLRFKETKVFPALVVPFEGSQITVTGHVLPGKRQLDILGKYEHAKAGRGRWPANQGFWVFRQGRLIRGGGWLGLTNSSDPHTQLARVAFEFPSALDHALQLPVDKSNIQLPKSLVNELRDYVRAVISEANERYRSQSKIASPSDLTGGLGSSRPIVRKASARTLAMALEKIANQKGLSPYLETLKVELKTQNSALADEIGW